MPDSRFTRVESATVAKHGRPVVVLAVEEYERLKARKSASAEKKRVCRRGQ